MSFNVMSFNTVVDRDKWVIMSGFLYIPVVFIDINPYVKMAEEHFVSFTVQGPVVQN